MTDARAEAVVCFHNGFAIRDHAVTDTRGLDGVALLHGHLAVDDGIRVVVEAAAADVFDDLQFIGTLGKAMDDDLIEAAKVVGRNGRNQSSENDEDGGDPRLLRWRLVVEWHG